MSIAETVADTIPERPGWRLTSASGTLAKLPWQSPAYATDVKPSCCRTSAAA